MNKLVFAKRYLLLVNPFVTSSVSAMLAVAISASPSLAATLGSSEAEVQIDNFSYNPQDIKVLTDSQVTAFASSGSVTAEANANAIAKFDPNDPPQFISNISSSKTSGEGSSYFGRAQSIAQVIAYNFLVENSKPFSFDFRAFLSLNTSIEDPQSESASATGALALNLYDSNDSNNLRLLDSFKISGNLITPGGDSNFDSQVNVSNDPSLISGSKNTITLTSNSENTSFGGTQETASALVQGKFLSYFAHPTSLTLIEVKANQASAIAVPEPSNTLAVFFFGLIGIGLRVKAKITCKAENLK